MISAISARSQVVSKIVEGAINTEHFIECLDLLIQDVIPKSFLVVDNLRVYHAKKVTEWLSDKKYRIEFVFLPPYASESNPDEYVDRDFKAALRSGPVSRDKTSLIVKATGYTCRLRTLPGHLMA